MLHYALIFVAGNVTVLNPCVLPLLPIVLASALHQGLWGPLALVVGMTVSFAVIGTGLTALSFIFGFDPEVVRVVGGWVLILSGVLLLSSHALMVFVRIITPLTSGVSLLSQRMPSAGVIGQAGVGVMLGIVWTPCTGPTLGAAIALAAQVETVMQSASMMFVFGCGVSIPLLALAYGSRQAFSVRRNGFRGAAKWSRPMMGWALLIVGFGTVSGFDRSIESWVLDHIPFWLIQFTTAF